MMRTASSRSGRGSARYTRSANRRSPRAPEPASSAFMVAGYAARSAGAGPQYGSGVLEQQQVVAWAVLPTGEACPAGLVGHGEHPRVAAVRAAADDLGLHVGVTGVREVTSTVESDGGEVSVHTLGVAYDAILL